MELLQIPATIEDARIKINRTMILKIHSQENLDDEQISRFSNIVGKLGWLCFMPERRIDISEVTNLPEIPEDNRRSPAVKQRAALWRLWEQGGKQGDFELMYRIEMEKILEKIKERLT